ncbi:uncharacterized protein TNCV_4322301 [Trichonephila clavipes]|uniref:Uncharacterized protein n=1 Tax=Trichonephila clavipes TaxID=2585209 RepID=A0A8X6SI12_TRICX|nr:uncharacterized protein TNCV_4322301 [Trichonephila clavipes]
MAQSHRLYLNYTAGQAKGNTKEDQRYHSEIYLAHNVLYKDQTIKITASCDVWMMTKSVVCVATIVGYNRCHTPRHSIKKALDVSLGFGSLHVASTYCQSSSGVAAGGVSRGSRCSSMDHTFSIGVRSGE